MRGAQPARHHQGMTPRRPRTPAPTTVVGALALAMAALALAGGQAAAAPGMAGGSGAVASSRAATAPAARGVTVSVFFLRGERLARVRRDVVFPALLRGAVLQLLAGPTAAERRTGLSSTVPPGTRLRGVAIRRDGLAVIDLSRRFESGGGTLSMTARLAQLAATALQFPVVRGVELRLDGARVRVFSGEGLILDGPLTRADVAAFR